MLNRRPTSTDVAKLAGVSRATVSYVLNGRQEQSIPEATRTKVHEAAKALGYTPHAAARTLRGGRSNIVLLAVRNIPYGRNLGVIVDRIAEQVAAAGLTLVIWRPTPGESLRTTLGHLQPRLAMSLTPLDEDEVRALQAVGVTYVSAVLMVTDELVGLQQVHHLAERGHRAIGYLGTADHELEGFATPRRRGIRRGCLELGLPPALEATVPVPPAGTVAEVVEVLRAWQAAEHPVTAVAAYNDFVAAACYPAAAELGLRVPDDLAVIGVDDEPYAVLLDPPLSTVRFDLLQLADRLVAQARASENGDEPPPPLSSMSVEVVARAST